MSTLQLLIVCFTAVVLAVIYAGTRAREAQAPVVTEGRVSLTVSDGQSIEGVVIAGPEGFVTLAGASLRTASGRATSMGGVVKLRQESITLIQELDAPRTELLTDPPTGVSMAVARNGASA